MEDYDEPKEITEPMKEGLARMFAEKGFVAYITNAMLIANKNALAALKMNEPDKAKQFAIRHEVFRQLLEKGRNMFINYEKIRKYEKIKITDKS